MTLIRKAQSKSERIHRTQPEFGRPTEVRLEPELPGQKRMVASKIEQSGAPQQAVDQIKGLDKREFSNLGDLQSTLGNLL